VAFAKGEGRQAAASRLSLTLHAVAFASSYAKLIGSPSFHISTSACSGRHFLAIRPRVSSLFHHFRAPPGLETELILGATPSLQTCTALARLELSLQKHAP
jgi:hypothetical protein